MDYYIYNVLITSYLIHRNMTSYFWRNTIVIINFALQINLFKIKYTLQ